jgi:hypothetical protein
VGDKEPDLAKRDPIEFFSYLRSDRPDLLDFNWRGCGRSFPVIISANTRRDITMGQRAIWAAKASRKLQRRATVGKSVQVCIVLDVAQSPLKVGRRGSRRATAELLR